MNRFYLYRFTLLLSLIAAAYLSPAQGENNIWVFGYHNGLDFNVTPPAFIETHTETMEGAAALCNASGQLLFYTNCDSVWDRNGNVMPNGSGMLGNDFGSTTQAAMVARFPDDTTKYYLFSLGSMSTVNQGRLFYSVVDMSLNNGFGDVSASYKNILLDTGISEQMTLVKGSCNSIWLVCHSYLGPVYHAFKISAAGITGPVISTGLGTWEPHAGGQIKATSSGDKIISAYFGLGNKGFELARFDRSTGILSDVVAIDSTPPYAGYYGLAFSPDGSKVYGAEIGGKLSQFDISAYPAVAAIDATEFIYPEANMGGAMRIGPDHKLYIARANSTYIACINAPDNPGNAAGVDPQAMHNPAWAFFPPNYDYVALGLGDDAVVNAGSGQDTTYHALHSVTVCQGDTVRLSPGNDYKAYLWNDGDTAASKKVIETGTYWVYGKTQCNITVDSYKVTKVVPSLHVSERDTTLCNNTAMQLHAVMQPDGTYLWNTGGVGASIEVSQAGTYVVSGTNECGTLKDSVKIGMVSCDCIVFVPNVFTPNGDGQNDLLQLGVECQYRSFALSIFNRYGERIFNTLKPEVRWDGTFKEVPCEIGTYFYYLSYTDPRGRTQTKKGDILLVR